MVVGREEGKAISLPNFIALMCVGLFFFPLLGNTLLCPRHCLIKIPAVQTLTQQWWWGGVNLGIGCHWLVP